MTTPPPTLTPAQLRILRLLSNADAPLWALDLARSTGIKHSTVYHAFRVLYDLGWAVGVTEKPTTPTGRPARVLYRLTARGRTEAAVLLDIPEEGIPAS